MDPDGTGLTRLTTFYPTGSDAQPAWSAAGTKIAFSRGMWGPPYDRQIWSMNADGSNQTMLTSGHIDSDPAWSPDGTKVVFARQSGQLEDIYSVNADGSGLTLLTTQGTDPAWSPDGSKIAFARMTPCSPVNACSVEDTMNIRLMNPDGTGQAAVTTRPVAGEFDPQWSPDGRKILFQLNADEDPDALVFDYDVGAVNPDGTGFVDLTNTVTPDESSPQWSPDGQKIVFVRPGHAVACYRAGKIVAGTVAVTVAPDDPEMRLAEATEVEDSPWPVDRRRHQRHVHRPDGVDDAGVLREEVRARPSRRRHLRRPSRARVELGGVERFAHGTTIATPNALVEKTGARTAIVTTLASATNSRSAAPNGRPLRPQVAAAGANRAPRESSGGARARARRRQGRDGSGQRGHRAHRAHRARARHRGDRHHLPPFVREPLARGAGESGACRRRSRRSMSRRPLKVRAGVRSRAHGDDGRKRLRRTGDEPLSRAAAGLHRASAA